ncbi:MAG TPA: hypothetical protein VGR87_08110 [Candidatus Limnocylindria bacterium]|nr:hypothetical protein [Candidatus Limnocylindria bacterium]
MLLPRVYVDFQNTDDQKRLKLTTLGTKDDLAHQGIQLKEGLRLLLYSVDRDDRGRPDPLLVEGTVRFNFEQNCWVAAIDWNAIRHESETHEER